MRVQFLAKGNVILYCDDGVLRITEQKTLFRKKKVKEFSVDEIGLVEFERGVLYFYDNEGICFEHAVVPRKYEDLADKIQYALNQKKKRITPHMESKKQKQKILKIDRLGLIFTIIFGIVYGGYLSYFRIIEPIMMDDTIPYAVLQSEVRDEPALSWRKYWILIDDNASKEDMEKIGKKIAYYCKEENAALDDVRVFFYGDERDQKWMGTITVGRVFFSVDKKSLTGMQLEGKFKGWHYATEYDDKSKKEKPTQEEEDIYYACLELMSKTGNDQSDFLFPEVGKQRDMSKEQIREAYFKTMKYKMVYWTSEE